MVLKAKEKTVLQDLQTQEKSCVDKYKKYAKQAKDAVLRDLFTMIQSKEQKHYDSLTDVLNGKPIPASDCNCNDGNDYAPTATYKGVKASDKNMLADKQYDCFLATDCIGTEKLVSSEYNTDVFAFENSKLRKLLADIQIEEQNHAEMLWKYKKANGMA